jgi:hypothetical protein
LIIGRNTGSILKNILAGNKISMWQVLYNTRQLKEWIEAARTIHARFGIEKALGYHIGEKFYHVAFTLRWSQELVRMLAQEKKKP